MRPFIKIRLTDNPESWAASNVIASWRVMRVMSQHLPRAILLYAALMTGDTSLLTEYFPWTVSRPAQNGTRRQISEPVVQYRAQSEEEATDDALDIGFGGIDL